MRVKKALLTGLMQSLVVLPCRGRKRLGSGCKGHLRGLLSPRRLH
jgi:hypothetical protein